MKELLLKIALWLEWKLLAHQHRVITDPKELADIKEEFGLDLTSEQQTASWVEPRGKP